MRMNIQQLRDRAELLSMQAANRGDKDCADAWDRISVELDRCQKDIATDWRIIEVREARGWNVNEKAE